MRTIFLADAHLNLPSDQNYRLLLRLLQELEGNLDNLYILGDLFDFWIGFPTQKYVNYKEILDALERLVNSGCKLVYFEGNHDFHLGNIFSERLQAEIHTVPSFKKIDGKRLYICHGDQINKEDRFYRLYRYILRSPIVAGSVKYFPPSLADSIRTGLQRRSKASHSSKKMRWNYSQILRDFAYTLRLQGCDGMVSGHFHLAIYEKLSDPDFTLLSLGDWIEQFTYGEMLDGELRLVKYSVNQ
ncbi:MAG: UDP-2,3-diacylglucosamine diphosphatase [Desulfuromonadaceae bacterium]|nr:UDP-2,3-diacylglucosamine diphosphatase [Desulfuromonadaceae bacterium]MDD2854800.1 UDP-2,3-diacylglucosamine diphosphatase [Desulfuromonadaceae bacterium]